MLSLERSCRASSTDRDLVERRIRRIYEKIEQEDNAGASHRKYSAEVNSSFYLSSALRGRRREEWDNRMREKIPRERMQNLGGREDCGRITDREMNGRLE